ncbi:hypothetical protein COT29_03215 [Candidatus Micrarchaeota archaeon CG08_land_8_20_14_0_20_59_11]|nr:MAG: hypothetical protein COT29_03215 [Candidatus Micrarchaeota archaeon CG08_land_8_20_14_0_20_59_11]
MDKCFLTTTPHYDEVTYYLRKWTGEVVKEAKVPCISLDETNATRANLQKRIASHHPVFLLINGHGSTTEIHGQGGVYRDANDRMVSREVILKANDNESITANTIVYARACKSLSQLGKSCVEHGGATAYIGYYLKFVFSADPNLATQDEHDVVANYFKEITNVIPTSILKGHTVDEAVCRSKDAAARIIKRLEAFESENPTAQAILPFLYYDLGMLGYAGDGNATI